MRGNFLFAREPLIGETKWAVTLQMHLQLLQAAKQHGIAKAFAALKTSAPQASASDTPISDDLLEVISKMVKRSHAQGEVTRRWT